MDDFAGERVRLRAFGNQLIAAHHHLLDQLDEKRLVRVLNALDAPDLEGWDEGS